MLNVNPEIEKDLVALAKSRGLSVDAYLREIVNKERGFPESGQSGAEKARAFLAWAESFPDTPPLSDEAVSRSSMYPDRW